MILRTLSTDASEDQSAAMCCHVLPSISATLPAMDLDLNILNPSETSQPFEWPFSFPSGPSLKVLVGLRLSFHVAWVASRCRPCPPSACDLVRAVWGLKTSSDILWPWLKAVWRCFPFSLSFKFLFPTSLVVKLAESATFRVAGYREQRGNAPRTLAAAMDFGRVVHGDVVVIQAGTGGTGCAALAALRRCGALPMATAGNVQHQGDETCWYVADCCSDWMIGACKNDWTWNIWNTGRWMMMMY